MFQIKDLWHSRNRCVCEGLLVLSRGHFFNHKATAELAAACNYPAKTAYGRYGEIPPNHLKRPLETFSIYTYYTTRCSVARLPPDIVGVFYY